MFNKDEYWFGVVLGAVATAIFYAVLYGVNILVIKGLGRPFVGKNHYLILLSVIPNLLLLRFYLGQRKFTKTGLSLLVLTIIFVLLYFFNFFQNPQ